MLEAMARQQREVSVLRNTGMSCNGCSDPTWNGFIASQPLSLCPGLLVPDLLKHNARASLVVQWLRICLLMQGTRVRALVWEDPTCRGAAGPVSHNY